MGGADQAAEDGHAHVAEGRGGHRQGITEYNLNKKKYYFGICYASFQGCRSRPFLKFPAPAPATLQVFEIKYFMISYAKIFYKNFAKFIDFIFPNIKIISSKFRVLRNFYNVVSQV